MQTGEGNQGARATSQTNGGQSSFRERIWVVTELYYPEETSTGHVMTGIAEALATDYDVNVLTGQPSYSMRGRRAPRDETHRGVHIRRVAATTLDKNVFVLRLINMITFTFAMLFSVVRSVRRSDLVLVVTNPPSLPFVIAFAAWLRGARALLLVHDVYPDVLLAAGAISGRSFAARLLGVMTRWLYRSVSHIVVIGRDMQELAKARAGDASRITFIPNWADEIEPKPREQVDLLRETRLEGKFVIQYAGNIGVPNDLETLLGAAQRLRENHEIAFLFLGSGSRASWLRQEVARRGIQNVMMVGSRPRTEQNDFLAAADLSVISLRRGMLGVSMPSRTYNTMAAARPILAICEPGSELWLLVNEHRIGWAVEPGAIDQLVAAVTEAQEEPALRTEMGRRARDLAVTRYSRPAVLAQWREFFSSLRRTRDEPI